MLATRRGPDSAASVGFSAPFAGVVARLSDVGRREEGAGPGRMGRGGRWVVFGGLVRGGIFRSMTLRYRLLLVYLIVVLLSVATVGVAIFELRHARQIIRQIQDWNGIVLNIQKLKSAWPPPSDQLDRFDLKALLAQQFLYLAIDPQYLDLDRVRAALRPVYSQYDAWQHLPVEERPGRTDMVRTPLQALTMVLEHELAKLNLEARQQDLRTRILLVVVMLLTVLHVVVVGWLLRRWLLHPMEQLNRQVEALARDEPPAEPLLTAPQEMANLALALDKARLSLGALRQQIIEGERLATIGQFAAQLAHNLRNPLASIRAAAQVSGRRVASDVDASTRMKEIVASVDRLNEWVARLTEVAQNEPMPTRSANVVPLLHEVRDALAAEVAAKELTLEVVVPADGLVCVHDPATLEHALIAMVVNAVEASPLGGRVTVSGGYVEENGEPVRCCIEVCDGGSGISIDVPDRIFEFSYSTKQRGMGLGLALARQAVQRQGGSVHARNNPEGGATVAVELPIEARTEELLNGE